MISINKRNLSIAALALTGLTAHSAIVIDFADPGVNVINHITTVPVGGTINAGDDIFTYENAASSTVTLNDIDIVVSAVTAYDTGNAVSGRSGSGALAVISMETGQTGKLKFSFYDSVTNDLVAPQEIKFSVLDIDGSESVTLEQVADLQQDANTDLSLSIGGGSATLAGPAGDVLNVDSTDLSSSPAASRVAAEFTFASANEITMSFTTAGSPGSSRGLFFAGDIDFNVPGALTPVPEASSSAFLGGLLAMAFVATRRRIRR